MSLKRDRINSRARQLAGEFAARVTNIPYERKGVLFSEMLFAYAILDELEPARIVESGRARGQSTHLLAACFPTKSIVSVEFDSASPDVTVASERLRPFANVELLFGDATTLLPEMVKRGDAVFIDGPKGSRGLRLALRLLATQLPVAVFLHDCAQRSAEREFLDRYMADSLFSDDSEFVESFAYLDQGCLAVDPGVARTDPAPGLSYGPTLGCLVSGVSVNYEALLVRLAVSGFYRRLRKSASKRWADA